MIKLFEMWTRRADLTHTVAVERCLADYGPVAARLRAPGTARLAINIGQPLTDVARPEAPPFDGITTSWTDATRPDAVAAMIRQRPKDLRAAEERAFGACLRMVTDEVVHLDRERPHRGVKNMFLFTRRPGQTHRQAVDYWRHTHAPLVADVLGPALARYSTSAGLPADIRGWSPEEAPPFDGIAELWFDADATELNELLSSVAEVLLPDERALMGTYRFMRVEEVVLSGDSERLPVGVAR